MKNASLEQIMNPSAPGFWGKIVLLISANLILIAGAGLTTAMPAILETFEDVPGINLWVPMIITLPALFVVVGGPITGYLTDSIGRKPVLLGSILLSGLAGTSAFFFDNLFMILITRALIGLAVAGAMTATNALIADYFIGQERAKFMGYHSAFLGLGIVVFLPIGGLLADISWKYPFLSYLAVLAFFLPALFAIREPEVSRALTTSQTRSRLTINSTMGFIYSAVFVLMFTFITKPVFQAFYLLDILNASGVEVGLIGGLSGLMTFFAGIFYERIGRSHTYHALVVFGFFLFGTGFTILWFARSLAFVLLGISMVGFGLGFNVANLTTWLAHEISPQMRGRANGIFTTIRFLAEFIGALVFAPIVVNTSYSFGYLLCGIIVILMGFFSLMIKRPLSRANEI
jgi:MFS family permease